MMSCHYLPLISIKIVFNPLPVEKYEVRIANSGVDQNDEHRNHISIYIVNYSVFSAVQESGLFFPGEFAQLTHQVQHSEFFLL